MILVRLNYACPVPFYGCEVEDGVGKCNKHSNAEARLQAWRVAGSEVGCAQGYIGIKQTQRIRERSEGVRGSVFTRYPCLESRHLGVEEAILTFGVYVAAVESHSRKREATF